MTAIDAKLQRTDSLGALIDWHLYDPAGAEPTVVEAVKDWELLAATVNGLAAVVAQLQQTLRVSIAESVRLTAQDVFGNLVTGARDNQIEVHFDDAAWATYVTLTTASGGGTTQQDGHVRFQSGVNTQGDVRAVTLDSIIYRPMHEVYAGWTADWPVAGVANSYAIIGLGDTTNGLFVGYVGTAFGLVYRRNGVDTFVAQAAWDDPCTGQVGSGFTRGGVPEALSKVNTNVFRVRVGLLGSATMVLEVYAPDGVWVPAWTLKRPNSDPLPIFTNFDLPMMVDINKNGAGATALEIQTACWAGGTTSPKARLSDTITDRSLADTVRSVIVGKTTGGGGGYVAVKVNPSGTLTADVTGSTVEVTNDVGNPLPVSGIVTANTGLNPLTDVQLRASAVAVTQDSGENEFTHVTATVSASGDTTIATPAAGKAIRLHWFYAINDPTATSAPLLKVKLGAVEIYRAWALSKRQRKTGAVNDPLVLNLSIGGTVAVTAIYEEV